MRIIQRTTAKITYENKIKIVLRKCLLMNCGHPTQRWDWENKENLWKKNYVKIKITQHLSSSCWYFSLTTFLLFLFFFVPFDVFSFFVSSSNKSNMLATKKDWVFFGYFYYHWFYLLTTGMFLCLNGIYKSNWNGLI